MHKQLCSSEGKEPDRLQEGREGQEAHEERGLWLRNVAAPGTAGPGPTCTECQTLFLACPKPLGSQAGHTCPTEVTPASPSVLRPFQAGGEGAACRRKGVTYL